MGGPPARHAAAGRPAAAVRLVQRSAAQPCCQALQRILDSMAAALLFEEAAPLRMPQLHVFSIYAAAAAPRLLPGACHCCMPTC